MPVRRSFISARAFTPPRTPKPSGRDEPVPQDGYHGAYVVEMGREFAEQYGDRFLTEAREQSIREWGRLGIQAVLDGCRRDTRGMDVNF